LQARCDRGAPTHQGGVKLLGKTRSIGLLLVLALAFALVPAFAMAAPAITQGIQGVVTDSVTGVGIPFATVHIDPWSGGHLAYITADYDGSYSYATGPGEYWMEAYFGPKYQTSPDPSEAVTVTAGAVTTKNFALVQDTTTPEQAVYRFFNMRAGTHFYTASDAEFINTYKNLPQFKYDGVAYWIPIGTSDGLYTNTNNLPLYRFFNKKSGVHFYTKNEAEKATVMNTLSALYTYEGVAYNVTDAVADPDGNSNLPIFRFYVPLRNAHFYTADTSEMMGLKSTLSNYYQFEGIGYYIGDWFYTGDI
jgi:hypothetical protein